MLRHLAVLLAAASLAACATSEDIVPITYTPPASARVAGAEAITVTVASTDARTTNRGRIGTQINGFGQDMAAIRAQEDLTVTVRSALSAELSQRGYALGANGIQVNAAVDTFFNRFESGMLSGSSIADVALTVTVADASGRALYRRPVTGHVQRDVALANGERAAESLSMALTQAMSSLFADAAFTAALAGTASTDPASRPAA